jgi:hypothetical protein
MARREPVVLLEPLAEPGHRVDLRDGRDLRQREPEPARQLAGIEQRREEQIERTDAASPRPRLETGEADADVGRRGPLSHSGDDLLRRPPDIGVFRLVAAVAIAVLEVEAKVFDRLVIELRLDAGGDIRDVLLRHSEPAHHLRHAAVRRDGRERCDAPLRGKRRGVTVAGDVDGVHGLTRAVVAGVPLGEEPVGRGENPLDLGQRGGSEDRATRPATRLPRAAGARQVGTTSRRPLRHGLSLPPGGLRRLPRWREPRCAVSGRGAASISTAPPRRRRTGSRAPTSGGTRPASAPPTSARSRR